MRRSGILLHVSSLPSPYGIGTLGKDAHDFIDYLDEAGQSLWEMLPLHPTGFGDSPYASWSTVANNPYFIDLDMLAEDGLLYPDEFKWIDWGTDAQRTDYGKLYNNRLDVLRKAVDRIDDAALEAWARRHPEMLEPALFMALKKKNGMQAWTDWPDHDKWYDPDKVSGWIDENLDEVRFWIGTQYLFDKQFRKLKAHAKEKGIQLVGDIPFYVSADSADVWAHPDLFLLDEEGHPNPVSGCPGQVWGSPLHNWKHQKKDGYKWWKGRFDRAADMFDILRLDHFIGFDAFYAIDPETKEGEWVKGPGKSLLYHLKKTGVPAMAEDLGERTASLQRLLKDTGIPGMAVMQYAFLDRMHEKGAYMPYNIGPDTVGYTGTHDNDTITGWIKSLNKGDLAFARDFMHSYGSEEQLNWDMIRTLMATGASTVILQAQDLKALDARMNEPGSAMGNWTWRLLPGSLDAENAAWVRKITETYGRLKQPAEKEEKEEN